MWFLTKIMNCRKTEHIPGERNEFARQRKVVSGRNGAWIRQGSASLETLRETAAGHCMKSKSMNLQFKMNELLYEMNEFTVQLLAVCSTVRYRIHQMGHPKSSDGFIRWASIIRWVIRWASIIRWVISSCFSLTVIIIMFSFDNY